MVGESVGFALPMAEAQELGAWFGGEKALTLRNSPSDCFEANDRGTSVMR